MYLWQGLKSCKHYSGGDGNIDIIPKTLHCHSSNSFTYTHSKFGFTKGHKPSAKEMLINKTLHPSPTLTPGKLRARCSYTASAFKLLILMHMHAFQHHDHEASAKVIFIMGRCPIPEHQPLPWKTINSTSPIYPSLDRVNECIVFFVNKSFTIITIFKGRGFGPL